MRAMVVGRYGPPEVFEVRESPEPGLKPGEVLIRVHAVGVGFADLMQRMGVYPDTPKPPFVPGFEVAGVIEQGPAIVYSAGKIKPIIGKTFALEEAAAAHRCIHNRQNIGKVVRRVM